MVANLNNNTGTQWISMTDMMSGLMLVFMYLFIAIIIAMPEDESNYIVHNYQDMKKRN